MAFQLTFISAASEEEDRERKSGDGAASWYLGRTGEKEEKLEEMRLDLLEIRQMYKEHVAELAAKLQGQGSNGSEAK